MKGIHPSSRHHHHDQEKWIYTFGESTDRELLGGKGANLGVMSRLRLPVPVGFTISTAACMQYQKGQSGGEMDTKRARANFLHLLPESLHSLSWLCLCSPRLTENNWPVGLAEQLQEHLRQLERKSGKRFGDPRNPLVSLPPHHPMIPACMHALHLKLDSAEMNHHAWCLGCRRVG